MLKVGDRITYKNGYVNIIKNNLDIDEINERYLDNIIKIERPIYNVIENKEILTEKERNFLKKYIEITKNNCDIKVKHIYKRNMVISIVYNNGIEYKVHVDKGFKNMETYQIYTLKELGLE